MPQCSRPPQNRWLVIFLLVLWGQLVFGVGMTLWRYSLVLFSGWQVYPLGVPTEFDGFVQLAIQSSAPRSNVLYLSPAGETYTARFARMSYLLYPRRLLWLGTRQPMQPIDRWTVTDLSASDLARVIHENRISCVVVDDIVADVLIPGRRTVFD